MNNAHYSWFILVPKTSETEWFQLSAELQQTLNARINQLSRWIKEALHADKLNTAIIGNVVEQMHIHIIGRKHNDIAWPAVVWGREERLAYSDDEIQRLINLLPL